jgi:hypothetical protein
MRPCGFITRIGNAAAVSPLATLAQQLVRSPSKRPWHQLVWSAFRMIGKSPSVLVIIYGEHSPDWMAALVPHAPVWNRMANVDEVLLIPDTPAVLIPEPSRRGVRTVVIPLMEDHTKHSPRQCLSLIPDVRSIDTLGSKAAFAAYVEANGLAHLCPKTYASSADAAFPCVLKRVDLNGGNGVAIVSSYLELQSRLEQDPWDGHPFILQSFVTGATEYVTHCVCENGQILWHCSFAYELNPLETIRTPVNVNTVRSVTATPFSLSQIKEFLSPLAYTGPCNVNYKFSDGEKIVVFEINPRLGGSLMLPQNVDYLHDAVFHIIKAALARADKVT